jgi:hypothetical protein
MRGVLIFQDVLCPELVREEPETVLRYVYTNGKLLTNALRGSMPLINGSGFESGSCYFRH